MLQQIKADVSAVALGRGIVKAFEKTEEVTVKQVVWVVTTAYSDITFKPKVEECREWQWFKRKQANYRKQGNME